MAIPHATHTHSKMNNTESRSPGQGTGTQTNSRNKTTNTKTNHRQTGGSWLACTIQGHTDRGYPCNSLYPLSCFWRRCRRLIGPSPLSLSSFLTPTASHHMHHDVFGVSSLHVHGTNPSAVQHNTSLPIILCLTSCLFFLLLRDAVKS